MKKLSMLFIATLMIAALGGCGTPPSSTLGNKSLYADVEQTALPFDTQIIYSDENGWAEGHINDIMCTYFFNFIVNSFYICSQYEDYFPAEGNELVVVEITVKNTSTNSIPMFDTDFQLQWEDLDNDAFSYPITLDWEVPEYIGEDMLPYEYTLEADESRTGLLVFEAPQNKENFNLSYLEEFDDDTTGDLFFVYFHDKDTCTENHFDYCLHDAESEAGYLNDLDYTEGFLNVPLHTRCFDFTIENAYVCNQYGDYTPAEGYNLVVAEITLNNTCEEDISIFNTDFPIIMWDSDDPYGCCVLNSTKLNETDGNVLPYEYTLAANESYTGLLIYEMPQGQVFSIYYLEKLEDDNFKNIFVVYFWVEEDDVQNGLDDTGN